MLIQDGTIYAELICPICNRMYTAAVLSERIAEVLEAHPQICPAAECQAKQQAKNEAAELETEAKEERRRAMENVRQRLDESGLLRYELGFDPGRPDANRALWSWMNTHLEHSVWIYGQTGCGKTRVIQDAAREAVKDRSVRYWPTYDLAARLTETAKRPEAQLFDIYDADLLVLDDLGVANMTAARLTALTAIVDRRYIGWDQVRRRQHGLVVVVRFVVLDGHEELAAMVVLVRTDQGVAALRVDDDVFEVGLGVVECYLGDAHSLGVLEGFRQSFLVEAELGLDIAEHDEVGVFEILLGFLGY